jgi:hypothetical protein
MNGFTLLAGLACILAILEQERAADLLHDGVPIAGLGLDGIRSVYSCGSGMKGEGSGRLSFLRMKRLRAAGTFATPLAVGSLVGRLADHRALEGIGLLAEARVPPLASTSRRTQGHHRYGPHAGPTRLPHAPLRRTIRRQRNELLRGEVSEE